MTEDGLKELLNISEGKDSFDSAIVRELFVEYDRLHNILAELDRIKPDLVNEITRLSVSLKQQPKELADIEGRRSNELAEMGKKHRTAMETIDKQNRLINLIPALLNSCLPHIRNPETADHIREKLLNS